MVISVVFLQERVKKKTLHVEKNTTPRPFPDYKRHRRVFAQTKLHKFLSTLSARPSRPSHKAPSPCFLALSNKL